MNSKKNLIFLGMMGSGKSTIGYLVSKKLGLPFIDIDTLIEKEEGTKIYNIFKKKGENYFRSLEEKITLKNLKNNDSVISLGGGSFVNKNIRTEILENHLSFWLELEESTLIKRIKNSKKRPLAFHSTDEKIKNLIKKRKKFYRKAQFKINCDKLTKHEIVKKIIKIYEFN